MSFTKITKVLSVGALGAVMATSALAQDVTLRFAGVFPIDGVVAQYTLAA